MQQIYITMSSDSSTYLILDFDNRRTSGWSSSIDKCLESDFQSDLNFHWPSLRNKDFYYALNFFGSDRTNNTIVKVIDDNLPQPYKYW